MVAAVLRFWQLGQLPPGLYRDEAYNGLDILKVLQGQHAWFFPANNGREPMYIYLSSLSVAWFGRSVFALRLAAAVAGTVTTLLVYALGKSWFDQRTGLAAAWLWAVTLWPVHLSRIGLRIILLPPTLTGAFVLATWAYRRNNRWLWLAAGAAYGVCFYTYLAVRFTPILVVVGVIYLVGIGRFQRLWPGLGYATLGFCLVLFPLARLAWATPELILGRAGQVSILNPVINQGDLIGAFLQQTARALGMFFWRGDDILRHNPAERPIFDGFMLLPFLLGLGWCLWQWRKPAAMSVLLWVGVMLGPTILAEDTPHFLRAAGILPAILLLPAIGLSLLWQLGQKSLPVHWPLPSWWLQLKRPFVLLLLFGSLSLTVRDYLEYGRSADVAYLFEKAATDMAMAMNQEMPETAVWVDNRFWSGWPAIPFLAHQHPVTPFLPEQGITATPPFAVYVWPYESLAFFPQSLPPTALITAETGSLARGDLESQVYPLYVRYLVQPAPPMTPPLANFADQLLLQEATIEDQCPQPAPAAGLEVHETVPTCIQIQLQWQAKTAVSQPITVFVHVVAADGGLIGQDDSPPANGNWPIAWWRPGLWLQENHTIHLSQPYHPSQQQIVVGLYWQDGTRLQILDETGQPVADSWQLKPVPQE